MKSRSLIPLAAVILSLVILFNPVTQVISSSVNASPDTSANNQTIWIFQGHRIIYHGPGNANNDSFGLGTFTQDASEPITYNITLFEPYWIVDGSNTFNSASSRTFTLSPGTYTYSNGQAPAYGIYGYIALETGMTYYIGWNVTTVDPPTAQISVPSSIEEGVPVQFYGSASGGIGSQYNYSWNFGNSITSTLQNPTVTFSKTGTYEVNLTATDYSGGYGEKSVNVTVGAPPSVSYVSHTESLSPESNTTASPLNVSLGQFLSNGTTSKAYTSWNTFSEYIRTVNGTLNALNGGEFAFTPGIYSGSSLDLTVGTFYANITYGSHTLEWQHVFDTYTPWSTSDSSVPYYSIAPVWNLPGPYSGIMRFNFTITSDPGMPYAGIGNTPGQLITHAVSGNGTYGIDNFNWTLGSNPAPTSIPFSYGYVWSPETYYFGAPSSPYYIHWNSSQPSTATYNTSVENGSNGEFQGTSYQGISFIAENNSTDNFPYNVTWETEPYPTVNIMSETNPADVGKTVTFKSEITGTGPFSYLWYVDGTSVSDSANLSYIFSASGSYNVTLETTDYYGNSVNASVTELVNSGPSVTANASYYNVDTGVLDHFYATESGGTPPVSYNWSIDGTVIQGRNVTYAFASPGNYSVQVTVEDSAGGTSYAILNINVSETPSIQISPNQAIASTKTEFSASASNGTGYVQLTWLFSSGSISGYYANHTFSSAGIHEVKIQASDQGGFSGYFYFNITVFLYVQVSASSDYGIAPLEVNFTSSVLGGSLYSYDWNFGNSKSSISQNPTETFASGNYTVKLTVTDQAGAEGYSALTIQALPQPVSLSYSPNSNITVLTSVQFTASAAWYASNYSILWSMPNGNQFSSMQFSYDFPVYSASNTVNADFTYVHNGTESYRSSILVKMVPSRPVISLTGYKQNILVNSTLDLNASGSFSYDATIQEYRWTYGNITYGQPSQSFSFHNSGMKAITLEIIDSLGAENTKTFYVNVTIPSESSDISLAVNETISSGEIVFNITATSNYAVQDVEAVVSGPSASGQTYFLNYESGSGNSSLWALNLNEYNFTSGTYQVEFVAFTNSNSNYSDAAFSISPSISSGGSGGFSGLGYFVSAVGGPTSFITLMGVLISGITVVIAIKHGGTEVVDIGGVEYESRPGKPLTQVKGRNK